MGRFKQLPQPVIAVTLASLTLSNVYGGLGFTWLQTLIMVCGTIMVLLYLVKIAFFPKTFLAEYSEVVTSSLYATFPMCMMVLGAFYHDKGMDFGKILWWAGLRIFVSVV